MLSVCRLFDSRFSFEQKVTKSSIPFCRFENVIYRRWIHFELIWLQIQRIILKKIRKTHKWSKINAFFLRHKFSAINWDAFQKWNKATMFAEKAGFNGRKWQTIIINGNDIRLKCIECTNINTAVRAMQLNSKPISILWAHKITETQMENWPNSENRI